MANLDRGHAFQELYALMAAKNLLSQQINAFICRMKDRGIDDANLIKAVIEEGFVPLEHRINREANERKKDAIFEEFFVDIKQEAAE